MLNLCQDSKQASLYFNYVILFVDCFSESQRKSILQSIAPNFIQDSRGEATEEFALVACSFHALKLLKLDNESPDGFIKASQDTQLRGFKRFLEKYSIQNSPWLIPPKPLPPFVADEHGGAHDSIMVTLANLQLIDVSEASWDQILEFRKNKQFTKRLRRLRTFLDVKFRGKSTSEIERSIYKLLEETERVIDMAKRGGFKITEGDISKILSLEDGDWSSVDSIFGVAGKYLAKAGLKVALRLSRRSRQLDILKIHNPMSYIIDAKQQLEQPDDD